jgi:ATP-dependent DNA ligase
VVSHNKRLLEALHSHPGRGRDAPVESTVINGEAILLRPDNTSDFEGLRSRQGQAEAILVTYDSMEADGQDVRPDALRGTHEQA